MNIAAIVHRPTLDFIYPLDRKKLNIKIPYLSMGMSDDYKSALNEGATHIRLGRILFN